MKSSNQTGVALPVTVLCVLIALGAVAAALTLSGAARISAVAVLVVALAGAMALLGAAKARDTRG
ncbi:MULTISPECIES: hypothetical protein [unclassified Streptomyces]|uniref:hypothetical protein n=1 Tax=unclassified Streptomyces TaxID=2593676 RepID=UPI001660BA27|nr:MULTISPECIES: hypothetical protein [unclassified Streptomyces]MBD0706878.1 hypothetical protein [Streptomyces sp. CBMA291]MBD0715014.1 hypothetical protein [Streptomyces sp. CBMA370]